MDRIVVVIDMINGFCKEGNLSDKRIMNIVPKLHDYLKKFDGEIIEVRDSHTEDSIEFKTFPVHCLHDTYESEGIVELKDVLSNSTLFHKNSTSAIFSPGFTDYIKSKNPKEIVVTGCCTDICVLNFVIPLRDYLDENNIDCDVKVYKDLVETYNSPTHNSDEYNKLAFTLMSLNGIKVE